MFTAIAEFISGLGGGSDPIAEAVAALVTDLSSQMTTLLPVGIGLMTVMALPRMVKKIVHTFM